MPQLTLRDVPVELHHWLRQQAVAHRRSLNQEVILQLDALRARNANPPDAGERLARIREIASRTARMPVVDARPEDEILGLSPDGLPG
jgi:plasmid stability protein